MLLKQITTVCLYVQIGLTWNTAFAQQTPPPGVAPAGAPAVQEPSTLLEYAKFLREEEQAYREYLEKLYTITTIVLGSLGTLGIGLITFLQFKTKKDVREAVDASFRQTVEKEVQTKLEQYRSMMEQLIGMLTKLRGEMEQFGKQQVHLGEAVSVQDKRMEELLAISMSEPIFKHLCGIGCLKKYIYRHFSLFQRELYFLKDSGFIRLKKQYARTEFGARIADRNLVEIAEPTEAGWSIIRLRKGDIPKELKEDEGNINREILPPDILEAMITKG